MTHTMNEWWEHREYRGNKKDLLVYPRILKDGDTREVKKAYGMHRILEHGLDTNVRNVGDATPGMLCFSSCGKDVIALERVLRRFTCDVAL